MLSEFPEDVKAAIEWFHEADRNHTVACQEYDRAFGEAYLAQAAKKREERFSSLSFGGEVERVIAILAASESRETRDRWALEASRRGNWLAYVMTRATGEPHRYEHPTTKRQSDR